MLSLRDQNAVITGASSGVGAASALALASQGSNLILVGRDISRLQEVAGKCADKASGVSCHRVDLLNEEQIVRFCTRVLDEYGNIDLLVHSAGNIKLARVAEATLEDFDRLYQCNVRAPFAITQMFLPGLIERKGQVIFINSTSGVSAAAGLSQYSATKHALKAVSDSLREEVNAFGVRVVSVFLGRTATPMQQQVHQEERRIYYPEHLIQPEQAARAIVSALMMERESEVTEIKVRPFKRPEMVAIEEKR
jgi:NADP-dependent 3-hydroxy acid dehydrogenase YdfG